MKLKRLFPLVVSLLMIVALCSCGGGGGEGSGGSAGSAKGDNYVEPSVKEFSLMDWDCEVTRSELVFDENEGLDNLVVTIKATNTKDEARFFEPNIYCIQGESDDYMDTGGYTDKDGNYLYTDIGNLEKCEPGKSCEVTRCFAITDYDSVIRLTFSGYTSAVKDTVIEFNVSGMQSEEAKKIADDRAAEMKAKQEATEADLDLCSLTYPEGWYADDTTESTVKLVRKNGESGQIDVDCTTLRTDAKEWCGLMNGNYGGNKTESEVTVNGTTWYRLDVNETQVQVFANANGGCINIGTFQATYDDIVPLLESIKIK